MTPPSDKERDEPVEFAFEPSTQFIREQFGLAEPGEEMGPYKLVSRIGEGGFGEVWVADRRDALKQRVAIKLIKPGMDSRRVVARFEQERQALAMMNHEGIARVLDGGMTSRGRPYFAMELVRGEPITAFCDRQRMGIRARLELLARACDAVHHAHIKGIVHRDLKPSNILAFKADDGSPRLKVIDFGVAKAISQPLTDKTIYTETGHMLGTPEYMSPEQADPGSDGIDVRTDIYSLGVLLYELLVGSTPFEPGFLRSKSHGDMQRILREEDPPTPSARLTTVSAKDQELATRIGSARGVVPKELAKDLRNELEWIPLMAMRKDPGQRYQSALDLGRDIGRYLRNEPVIAGPETHLYRLGKFYARNRLELLITTVAVASVAALAVAIVQKKRTSDLARDVFGEVERRRLASEAYVAAFASRWSEARDSMHAIVRNMPGDHFDWYTLLALEAHLGGTNHLPCSHEALARFGATVEPFEAERIAKAVLLVPYPRDSDIVRLALGLARKSMESDPAHPWRPSFQLSRALALYRAGDFAGALKDSEGALGSSGTDPRRDALVHAVAAMSLNRLGRAKESRAHLESAMALVPPRMLDNAVVTPSESDAWIDWLMARVLVREAMAEIPGGQPRQPRQP